MAIETRTKTIDGKTISVTQLPARRALKIQTRLVKLLGGSVASLFASSKGSLSSEIEPAALTSAIDKLAEKLNEDDFLRLIMDILQSTKINNQDINESSFDLLFPGSFLFMYKIVVFTLQVNYEDFFGEGGIGSLLERVPSAAVVPDK